MSVTFYIEDTFDREDIEVNVSNTNAGLILQRLDLWTDWEDLCGSADATDFLGRVLLASGTNTNDDGTPVSDTQVPGHARMIDCGLAPGYYDERFGQLADLALAAQDAGRKVVWA